MESEKPEIPDILPVLSEANVKEFAQEGKKYSDSNPASGNILKNDLYKASTTLVESTEKIVGSINVVIGAILDQNRQMKENHNNERMMIGILDSELRGTQRDNERTRQLVWGIIVISFIFMISQLYMIIKIQAIMVHQHDSLQSTGVLFNKLFNVVSSIEETQRNVKDFVEQTATIAIRPADKKGSASIEVKQPVNIEDGKIEYDVVRIPVNLSGGEVRPPIHEEAVKEKTPIAEKVNEALK